MSYNIGLIESYAPGHAGAVKLTVAKDRNGGVGRVGQTIADVVVVLGSVDIVLGEVDR